MNDIVNEEFVERWIEALESGDYEQTTKVLHDEKGFCCLGVATDIYQKDHDLEWKKTEFGYYCDRSLKGRGGEVLPEKVQLYIGAKSCNEFRDKCLSQMNDNGASFTEIAQVLREELEEYRNEIR